ncbi:serine/threonine-protein kinase [Corynebacterium sp. 335C]
MTRDLTADAAGVQEMIADDRYRVSRVIGRGGMATVWLADDVVSGRPVAVKVLKSELSGDPEFRQRFRNEASAARSVDSPNVVTIHRYNEGTAGGRDFCFIIMEFIRGEALDEVLRRRGDLPEHLAVDVVLQTAHGLSAIHAAGLVHRDIKPANLLVTPEGLVKITDFGIAKAAEAVPLTRTGFVVGTAQYLSPEQAAGRDVDPATDIYSLGCVAYEMTCGRRPFGGDSTVAIALKHLNDPPPPLPRTVHPHVRELIGIMLRKNPGDRYADGRELALAVEQVRMGRRPPQPRGSKPAVHRQSDAADPGTRELGRMTRTPAGRTASPSAPPAPARGDRPGAGYPGRPAGPDPRRARPPARDRRDEPARRPRREPAPRSGGCCAGCLAWSVLVVVIIIALLAIAGVALQQAGGAAWWQVQEWIQQVQAWLRGIGGTASGAAGVNDIPWTQIPWTEVTR